MKEKIKRFSKGEFEYELPFTCLSIEEIKITLEAGKTYEGSFTISNSIGRSMKGVLYSSNRLLTIENSYFCGEVNTVNYQFNSAYLSVGELIQGEISIVSDCGELTVPFSCLIEAPYLLTSLGKTKDLFQFANLARTDWTEAKKVFRCEEFEKIFLRNEEQYKNIYHSLRKGTAMSQAMEEFLIAIHKKSVICLSIDKTNVEYFVEEEGFMDKLILTKNDWGYAEIRVSTDAPFIQLEQKFVWTDRFVSNTHQITYVIDDKQLRPGNNYGRIWLKTIHQTIVVEVVCKYRSKSEQKVSSKRMWQLLECRLTRNYLKFRLNHMNRMTYMEETKVLLEQMSELEYNGTENFLKIHLSMIAGNEDIVKQGLEDLSKEEVALKNRSVLGYCTYLYFNALYYKEADTIKNTVHIIRKYYENGYFDWRVLWFLLYTDKRYEKNKGLKLLDIKEQFEAGCRSPILYYEAICIYNEEPYLLRELSVFEIQVLNFGIRNWILSKDVSQQYTYLANKKKRFEPIIFRGLINLYDKYETVEILTAICCMLIKGLKKSTKYFKWYCLGVESQLRVTELYEYYMYSMEDTTGEPFAQPVLFYFIYNSNLNDQKKAILYSNIVKNKQKNEDIYHSYYKKMKLFALKQLEAHHISRELATLYQDFLDQIQLNPDIEKNLPYVLYKHELVCENPNMVGVTVIHKELGVEENQPLYKGKALVDIYTDNAVIVLSDEKGNRFTVSVEYTLQSLLSSEKQEELCVGDSNHPMLLLHLFDKYQSYQIMNEKSIYIRKQVLQIEGLNEAYSVECLQTLIDYYYENYNEEHLEDYLQQINLYQVKKADKTKFLEYMVIRCFYEKVLEAYQTIGVEGVSINRLVKMCSRLVITAEMDDHKQEVLLALCFYVFEHGKYNETILNYLVNHYYGPTGKMYQLWKAAKEFELETHKVEERLLVHMLFAESYVYDSFQVFQEYYKNVANYKLVTAYLSFYAYKFIVQDRVLHPDLFPIMKRELNYEENDIYLLAWLKYHSSKQDFMESELSFIDYNIHRLEKKGIVLPFFIEYKNVIKLPERILDQYYLEYITDPQRQVYIHYRLINQKDGKDYITERMTNTFMGIHIKQFMLFYQEILQYYITEEYEEEVKITESFHVAFDRIPPENEDSKYNQINLMLMAMEMRDEKTLLDMLERYVTRDYAISKCFQPLD